MILELDDEEIDVVVHGLFSSAEIGDQAAKEAASIILCKIPVEYIMKYTESKTK